MLWIYLINIHSRFIAYCVYFYDNIILNILNQLLWDEWYICAVKNVFEISSFTFTYLGLKLGNILSEKFGHYATMAGGILLIILGIYYLI